MENGHHSPQWNSCYVSGTTQGVAVDVRRAGTAGDKPAADVYDDLITNNAPRVHVVLLKSAKAVIKKLSAWTMPLFPPEKAPGLSAASHALRSAAA